MKYREIVKNVSNYSGFSEDEAERALDLIAGILASHLNAAERRELASQLPAELQYIVLEPKDKTKFSLKTMYERLATLQNISAGHAKKQVVAVWLALKDAISPSEVADIRACFPRDVATELA